MMRSTSKQYAAITTEQIVASKDALVADHFAILMAAAAGSNYSTMAAALQINVGTVKSRLNRARHAIRAELRKALKHPNGKPMYAPDGTLLDEDGTRSIFDDVAE